MDPIGDGGGGLAASGSICAACGTKLRPDSRFCNKCGAPIAPAATSAEYKQVTVLFADVVHSMDIAATVGAERLREIMTDLVGAATAVVQRYGGTVDKFTGDGIMAVFGAPVAMEDHAVRACLAALGVQAKNKRLAVEVRERDGVDLQLRVGLNSGQVIAGEIGSGPFGYTAVGEQVGLAQRMESMAPPGGVMLSEATARLVEDTAVLGEPELVHIKGADTPMRARQLLSIGEREPRRRARHGDRDDAIPLMRAAADHLFGEGRLLAWGAPATGVLVETLLDRGVDGDAAEAETAIERLAAAPTDDGVAVRDIWLLRLRALLARAHGDAAAYAHLRDCYRDMARTLGFEGHIAWAEAMP